MANDSTSWHGWVSDQRAMFLQHDSEDGYLKAFIQQDRSVVALATFHSDEAGQVFMQWMDETLTEQAEANAELLRRLQNEQPLLFAQSVATETAAGDAVDLDDEEFE